MITVTRIEDRSDCYCNACVAHRKPYFEQLTFYKISYGTDKNMQSLFRLCDECASQLAVRIYDLEGYGNDRENGL